MLMGKPHGMRAQLRVVQHTQQQTGSAMGPDRQGGMPFSPPVLPLLAHGFPTLEGAASG